MKEGGIGGAGTQTDLDFENKVDLLTLIKEASGYAVRQSEKAGRKLFAAAN